MGDMANAPHPKHEKAAIGNKDAGAGKRVPGIRLETDVCGTVL